MSGENIPSKHWLIITPSVRNYKWGRVGCSYSPAHRCHLCITRRHRCNDSAPQLWRLELLNSLLRSHQRFQQTLPRVGLTGQDSLCDLRLQCACRERFLSAEPKDSPSKAATVGSFEGCRPWIDTQHVSYLSRCVMSLPGWLCHSASCPLPRPHPSPEWVTAAVWSSSSSPSGGDEGAEGDVMLRRAEQPAWRPHLDR